MEKLAVLTSGGDSPGMNAAIRAVVRTGLVNNFETYIVNDGYKGLFEDRIVKVDHMFVSEIIHRGGTIIGTARLPEFLKVEVQRKAAKNLKEKGIYNLVVIGGDGSYKGALALSKFGINVVCLPGTIDNDIVSTDFTIGFDTALNTAVEAIDKLRDTSTSHQRISIVEVMGRDCGDLALFAGAATGAELILTAERKISKTEIIKILAKQRKKGKKHGIVVVSENLLDLDDLAKYIEKQLNVEVRATVLGHVQRGGYPSAADRVLATRMGVRAVEALIEKKPASCIGIIANEVEVFNLKEALSKKRKIDLKFYKNIERLK
jgi:6-phosphofructokinase 1